MTLGSCVDAAYDGCCVDENCGVTAQNTSFECFCDALCYKLGDCCEDIGLINCFEEISEFTTFDSWASRSEHI